MIRSPRVKPRCRSGNEAVVHGLPPSYVGHGIHGKLEHWNIEAVACMSPLKSLCTTFFPATLATGVSSGLPSVMCGCPAYRISLPNTLLKVEHWTSRLKRNHHESSNPFEWLQVSQSLLAFTHGNRINMQAIIMTFPPVLPPWSTLSFCLRAPVLHQVADGKNVWHLIPSG